MRALPSGVSPGLRNGGRAVATALALLGWSAVLGEVWSQEPSSWRIQAAASRDSSEAAAQLGRVHEALGSEHTTYLVYARPYYAVRVGDFAASSEARSLLARVRRAGWADAWLVQTTPMETLGVLAGVDPMDSVELADADSTEAAGGSAGPTEAQSRVVEPPGSYHGVLEAADCAATFGWVWDSQRPDQSVSVDIFEGGALVATVLADRPRRDLAAASKGDGRHGFNFELPPAADPNGVRSIRIQVAGRKTPLMRSPITIDCEQARSNNLISDARGKRMLARRIAGNAVQMDGVLDDEVWGSAAFAADFQQKGPDRGFPAPERTEIAFLYDEDALYVGARMFSRHPEELRSLVRKRDDPANAERLLVSLDTYLDRRTAYTFGVTAGGVRVDYYHPRDDELARDNSFDPVWEARTVIDSLGWTAELRIPFDQLRFGGEQAQTFGVNVRRWSPERFLNVYWVVVPLYESGWASRFGTLAGMEAIEPERRLAVRPYVLGGATFPDIPLPAGAAGLEERFETRVGGDLSMGFGSNLTLEATFNPDFGQVEADPAEVNLTAYETFFEERRPFFVEGNQLLRGQGPDYFYSRRIGAIPMGIPVGDAVHAPTASMIYGASKLTGRLESGLSVGSLVAVTAAEQARVYSAESGDISAIDISPTTFFGVGRVEQEIGDNGTTAGLILTGVNRSMQALSPMAAILPGTAISGGGDWNVRLPGGSYELTGYAGFSHVAGTVPAILRVQTSSARFFQRPDAGHVSLDSTATSLTGYTAGLGIKKVRGENWLWEGGGSIESPGFELSDAGILPTADDMDVFAGATYRQPRASGPVKEFSVSGYLNSGWNLGGTRQYTTPSLYARGTLPNFWRGFAHIAWDTRALSDDLTRGGPLMGTGSALSGRLGLLSRFGAPTQWSFVTSTYFDEFGGWNLSINGGLTVQLEDRFELSLWPGYTRGTDSRQYYGTLDGGGDATYGRRYVFSYLERSEIYTQIRLNFGVTRQLGLELYVEPFASSGRFFDFGELVEAGGRDVRTYGQDGTTIEPGEDGSFIVTDGEDTFVLWNADFHVRSFRTNAVLRWEWSAGSTFYLIWQQNRWSYANRADAAGPASLFRSVGDTGEHVLVAKLSYWFSLD